MTLTCPGRYEDDTTGRTISCQWQHNSEGMHHAHEGTRCIVWTEGLVGISPAVRCPQPPAKEFTEYGYLAEYPDGIRCFMSFLGEDRERALGQFRTLETSPDGERLVFVSRRITQTPWSEES